MALSPTSANPRGSDSDQIDRLSDLPDALLLLILSFLPTRLATRTSVLSRRFRRFWEASPFLDLVIDEMPEPRESNFSAVADRLLLRRDPANPLLDLILDISDSVLEHDASCLLAKACTFKLRHFAMRCAFSRLMVPFLPNIFSLGSLESLSLPDIIPFYGDYVLPSAAGLTRLRTLSIGMFAVDPAQLNRFISELCSLEDLSIKWIIMGKKLRISSNTVKKLKLIIVPMHFPDAPKLDSLMMCLPSLELLHLEYDESPQKFPIFQGEIPLVKKVVLTLNYICKEDCWDLAELMKYVSHTRELILYVKEYKCEEDSFIILFEPGKEMTHFPKLKHFEATMCFREPNLKAIVSMLHHSPVLESVKLVHECQKKDWTSKLPRNADGNSRYCCFTNLHLGENRENFKVLSKRCYYKSQA